MVLNKKQNSYHKASYNRGEKDTKGTDTRIDIKSSHKRKRKTLDLPKELLRHIIIQLFMDIVPYISNLAYE